MLHTQPVIQRYSHSGFFHSAKCMRISGKWYAANDEFAFENVVVARLYTAVNGLGLVTVAER
jgi:hypothetical protein